MHPFHICTLPTVVTSHFIHRSRLHFASTDLLKRSYLHSLPVKLTNSKTHSATVSIFFSSETDVHLFRTASKQHGQLEVISFGSCDGENH